MSVPGRSKAFLIFLFILTGVVYAMLPGSIFNLPENFSREEFFQLQNPDSSAIRKKQDSLFQDYITRGEALLLKKEPEKALPLFESAQKIRPSDQRLRDRIAGIKNQISDQSRKNSDFQKAIASGDTYFNAKDYLNAKASYQVAIDLIPSDTVAKAKLRRTMDLLRSQKAQNILYDVAVASADKLFQARDYEKAKAEYENAGKILPQEQYPRDKINEIIKIQIDRQVNDELYSKAITAGDKYFLAKSYQMALLEFQKAQGIRPDEPYPKQKIAELTTLLAAQKTTDEAYNKAIAQADNLFKLNKYADAIKGYQQALGIKPAEQYPKNRIREIEGLLARKKSEQEEYDRYLTIADSLYIGKNYLRARENYAMASAVKPAESYPKEMLAKADNMLTGREAEMARAMDQQWSMTITAADKLLKDKAFEAARAEYLKASQLKPSEKYPIEKIQEIDKFLADKLALDEQYKQVVAGADRLFTQKSYEPARTEYQKASGIKPQERYPLAKINEIDSIVGGIAKARERDEDYRKLLLAADKSMELKEYEQARDGYNKALAIKPSENYPKTKLAEIDRILAGISQQKALEEKYGDLVRIADSLLGLKLYEPAKSNYLAALKLKPAESYPKGQVTEIERILAQLSREKSLSDQYLALMQKGESQVQSRQYTTAKTSFQQASVLKPEESLPKQRMAFIDSVLQSLADAKALDEKYRSMLSEADKLFSAKSYETARAGYVTAGNLKPAEQYPKERIALIDQALGEIAAKKALDEQYQSTIAGADKAFAAKEWEQAKGLYANAGILKPGEQYPKTRISEIDKILADIAREKALEEDYIKTIAEADKLFGEQLWDAARAKYVTACNLKPAEQYPKTRIAEIDKALGEVAARKAREDQYAATIASADKLFAEKNWEKAKSAYSNALQIKPGEKYPGERIGEIESIIAGIAKQKAIDDQYNQIIARADQLLAAKSYETARSGYLDAGNLKPAEQYPKDKLAEIDKVLSDMAAKKALDEQYAATITEADKAFAAKAYDQSRTLYINAGNIKPSEQYPKTRIAEIDRLLAEIAKQKALDEDYASLISNADKLLSEKSYEQSKSEYQKAGMLKPSEQYPKMKISEIDKILADLAALKAIDDQYAAAITSADKLFTEKSWDQAKVAYANAGKIKPAEQYPKDKINEIIGILTGIAKQKALDDQYNGIIARADQLLASKSYEQARTEYVNAGTLKPAEQYPKDKISELEGLLAEIKVREEAYKASVARADQLLSEKKYDESSNEYQNALTIKPEAKYPSDKIAEINRILTELKGKRQTFDDLVSKGDKQFTEKEWMKAKGLYQQALTIFPEENYPREKISLITSKIDSIYRANRGKYDQAVADGDRFYNSFEFDKAVDAYTLAISLLPMENYPRDMISKIRKTIAENAIVDVLKSAVTITAGEEKQFPFTPVNMASRKNNYVYVKIRNLSGKPFNVLMRYGQDKQPGGGIVIRNLSTDGKVNDRLISVKDQDAWYRVDNNWISLYPQGGDVEVTFIQVSRAQKQ